jgi:hypothetical protein
MADTTAKTNDYKPYLPFSGKGKYSPFDELDGVTGYDIYGEMQEHL